MHFVPKFYKLVPVNFNFYQCLYVASTGISGVVHSFRIILQSLLRGSCICSQGVPVTSWSKWLFYWLFHCSYIVSRILSNFMWMWTFQGFPMWMLTDLAFLWIFQLNLICSLRETLRFCRFCRVCSFLRGATVNGVNQVWMLCSYVCLCEWPFLLQSRRATEVPMEGGSPLRKAPCRCLWPCLVWVTVWMFCWFCSFSCQGATQTRPAGQHPVYVLFLFSLFQILAFPLAFQFLASFANCSCFAGASVNKGQYQYFL